MQRSDSQMTDTLSRMKQRAMSMWIWETSFHAINLFLSFSQGIDNISFLSPPMSKPMQYDYEKDSSPEMKDFEANEKPESSAKFESEQTRYIDHENEEEEDNIIPWKKLLRKTNSRLTATWLMRLIFLKYRITFKIDHSLWVN